MAKQFPPKCRRLPTNHSEFKIIDKKWNRSVNS